MLETWLQDLWDQAIGPDPRSPSLPPNHIRSMHVEASAAWRETRV